MKSPEGFKHSTSKKELSEKRSKTGTSPEKKKRRGHGLPEAVLGGVHTVRDAWVVDAQEAMDIDRLAKEVATEGATVEMSTEEEILLDGKPYQKKDPDRKLFIGSRVKPKTEATADEMRALEDVPVLTEKAGLPAIKEKPLVEAGGVEEPTAETADERPITIEGKVVGREILPLRKETKRRKKAGKPAYLTPDFDPLHMSLEPDRIEPGITSEGVQAIGEQEAKDGLITEPTVSDEGLRVATATEGEGFIVMPSDGGVEGEAYVKHEFRPEAPAEATPTPESAEGFAEKLKRAAQTHWQESRSRIEQMAGWSKRTVEKFADRWNEAHWSYKTALGLALGGAVVSGAMTTGLASAAIIGGTAGLRHIITGVVTYVAADRFLAKSYTENSVDTRTTLTKMRHQAEAITLGVLFGGYAGQAIGNIAAGLADILETSPKEITYAMGTVQKELDVLTGEGAPVPETTSPEVSSAIGETPVAEHLVEKGDTVWSIIGEEAKERGFTEGLNTAQQTYLIDAAKDRLAAMNPAELREMGISSGDVNLIKPGEAIDLSSLFADTASLDEVRETAQNLSPQAQEHILSYEAPHAVEHTVEAVHPADVRPEVGEQALDAATLEQARTGMEKQINEIYGRRWWHFDAGHRYEWEGVPEQGRIGVKDMEVEKVLNKDFGPHFGRILDGIEQGNRKQLLGYLVELRAQGITPLAGETTGNYMLRALIELESKK